MKFQKSKIFWPAERIFGNFRKNRRFFGKILKNSKTESLQNLQNLRFWSILGAEKSQIRLDFRPEPPAEAKKISDFGEAKKRQKTPKFLALAKKTTINL